MKNNFLNMKFIIKLANLSIVLAITNIFSAKSGNCFATCGNSSEKRGYFE